MQQQEQDHSHHTSHLSIPGATADSYTFNVYPTNLLNLYCAYLLRQRNQTSLSSTLQQHQCDGQRLDESLRVIDFLFEKPAQLGHNLSSSSLTEGAMQILDNYFMNYAHLNHEMHSSLTTTNYCDNKNRRDTYCSNTIARMQSPAGRSLYLVSKGSKSGAKYCSGIANSGKQEISSHCFCILSDELPLHYAFANKNSLPLSYCSCRSFFELNRTTSHEMCESDGAISLCKHLLAIKLLPVFDTRLTIAPENEKTQFHLPTMEVASEEDYSRAIIQRLRPKS